MLERYKLKKRGRALPLMPRKPSVANDPEQLLGTVQGMDASDLEERFAKALYKRKKNFYFRVPLGTPFEPGWKELDFLVIDGGYFPVEVDQVGFIHLGKEAEDAIKDAFVMEYLNMLNPFPVKRVSGERLQTQEDADNVVQEMFP